jgi:hypothetical protein
MKISTSNRQDAQTKRELTKEICLRLKLAHKSNDEIAQALYDNGIGVEREGALVKPYSPRYVTEITKNALREVAAERGDHGKLLQIELEQELTDLISFWRPRAMDNDAPSLKAADFVRKAVADLATLSGANEPVKVQVQVQVNNALESFVNTLKELMPEEHFEHVIKAIERAEEINNEYWREQKQLQSADVQDIIDVEVNNN